MNLATFFIYLVFLALAFRRLTSGQFFLTARSWRAAMTFGLGLSALVLAGCASLFFLARFGIALRLVGKTILDAAPQILAAWVFLLVALATPRHALGRVLPGVDLCLAALRTRCRRRIAWKGRRALAAFAKRALQGAEWTAYLVAMVAFSSVWLRIAVHAEPIRAGVSPELTDWVRTGVSESGEVFWVATAILAFLAPFTEETVFRGFCLQEIALLFERWARNNRRGRAAIGKPAFIGAVALTAALWSVGHAGAIDPGWVKWVQIFGIGCVLGVARLRLGLEACIALHLGFNALGGYFVPPEMLLSSG